MSVDYEKRGTTAILTVNRPKALNAINRDVIEGLARALDAIEADPEIRAAVLTGAGDKAFVAGADIAAMQALTAVEAEEFAGFGQAVFNRMASCRVPVIAAVQGFALGGGCELAMATDMIFAGPKARFGQPEVKLGVIPGFGGTQRLVRRVGMSAALDLCLTGRMVKADEAVRMGLASRITGDDVLGEAIAAADAIAALGPVAVRLCKRAIHENADADLTAAQAAERTLFGLCFATQDQEEGMSAFLEKRSATFTGS